MFFPRTSSCPPSSIYYKLLSSSSLPFPYPLPTSLSTPFDPFLLSSARLSLPCAIIADLTLLSFLRDQNFSITYRRTKLSMSGLGNEEEAINDNLR
ncbi:hypothetical protein FCM35_KLT19315 [Carex littledalei]|uniref:Uncharacterized protein n=1 Tax=Carex littledalei TaxID=544730 RepID=A0A833R7W4_9POAL|nr:hypothetical protein FCM35_KLT19315 [Carex littledalei]